MTDPMMNRKELLEKTPDADVPREMIGFAAERLMELEVGALTGASFGEKSRGHAPSTARCCAAVSPKLQQQVDRPSGSRLHRIRSGRDLHW